MLHMPVLLQTSSTHVVVVAAARYTFHMAILIYNKKSLFRENRQNTEISVAQLVCLILQSSGMYVINIKMTCCS